ncbi:NAD-dependent epimerase/dehydratase family protein [Mycetocola zhadangensis]|uniref:NAD-dependent epimerase/dehydratase family protein n=1 Tax=Mycetocola zhadangensis TaxID=1164595 RepID=A0A3L7IS38_9MICO|nr:NAD-dependent epimerase/dehydratase family protein [Mycetocola zhadangensis]RLQ81034.1 NAD-dependent epimerase/dehydratase family protein [Mycetocola zhadangensis]GGF04172.1 NAD-dependent epimerase [Mycetocola zhadangensis]
MSVLVLGAGPVGSTVARAFLDRGEQVTVATRSGTAPEGVTSVRLDAADVDALTRAASGHSTVAVCTNPPYNTWRRDWPPIIESVIGAARSTGANIVMIGNLYSYGMATMPMRESSPEEPAESKGEVRRDLWAALRAATERGDVQAVEVRASDYFGPGAAGEAHLGTRFFDPILANKRSWAIGNPALPHSWAYLPDLARTVVAASEYRGDWGRVWHVPAASNLSRTEICRIVNARYGVRGSISGIPSLVLKGVGTFNPILREVSKSSYQFLAPFLSDATETESMLDVGATAWERALDDTVAYYRSGRPA